MYDWADALDEAEAAAVYEHVIEPFIERLLHRLKNPQKITHGYYGESRITKLFNERHQLMMESEINKVLRRLAYGDSTEWDFFDMAEIKEIEQRLSGIDSEMESAFELFLENECTPPKIKNNQKESLEKQRKRYLEICCAKWEEYPDFLSGYFERNPTNSLTAARIACATKFHVCLKTIERRTKGYKRPPRKNCRQARQSK